MAEWPEGSHPWQDIVEGQSTSEWPCVAPRICLVLAVDEEVMSIRHVLMRDLGFEKERNKWLLQLDGMMRLACTIFLLLVC